MVKLLSLATAPAAIGLFYIYIRDKYEKEPFNLLIVSVIFGIIIAVPIVHVGNVLMIFMPTGGMLLEAFYLSFVTSAFVEEFFKYIVLYFLVWRNRNLNEKFDGIVYAVFISLGFASIENIMYVFSEDLGGTTTAINRAIFSIPAHALFGVVMGYHFTMSKFEKNKKTRHFILAFTVPWLLHAVYNFILLSNIMYAMFFFLLFVVYLWITGFRKMKNHIENSPFKT